MADGGEYDRLKRLIEEGVRAAEEMDRLLSQQQEPPKRERPKRQQVRLRLIKGGLVGATAGWLWRRGTVGVAAAGVAFGAPTLLPDEPHYDGSAPPRAPATARPRLPVATTEPHAHKTAPTVVTSRVTKAAVPTAVPTAASSVSTAASALEPASPSVMPRLAARLPLVTASPTQVTQVTRLSPVQPSVAIACLKVTPSELSLACDVADPG